ncbi:hypothetical protein HDU97_008989, partial [Phlyctochytrium planicorne]
MSFARIIVILSLSYSALSAGLPADPIVGGWVNVANELQSRGERYSGRATYYGDGGGDPAPLCSPACGACGTEFIPNNHNYFAAVATNLYNRNVCGQCAHVYANGNKVIVPIV